MGTGFTTAVLQDLQRRLGPLATTDSLLGNDVPRADAAVHAGSRPSSWARYGSPSGPVTGECRTPAWRGLRPDKTADQVVDELDTLTLTCFMAFRACYFEPPIKGPVALSGCAVADVR